MTGTKDGIKDGTIKALSHFLCPKSGQPELLSNPCPEHCPVLNTKSLNRITLKRDNGITKSVKNKDTRFR